MLARAPGQRRRAERAVLRDNVQALQVAGFQVKAVADAVAEPGELRAYFAQALLDRAIQAPALSPRGALGCQRSPRAVPATRSTTSII
jgi:hypothetical protein